MLLNSVFMPGQIMDYALLFLRMLFGQDDYYPEYKFSNDPTQTLIHIQGPFTKNMEVVDGKPKIIVAMEDLKVQHHAIKDDFSKSIYNGTTDETFEKVKINIVDTGLRVTTTSSDYWECMRLHYIASMALHFYSEDIVANSEGRLIGMMIEVIGWPTPVVVDSNTETFAAQTFISIKYRELWNKTDTDLIDLSEIDIGYCTNGTLTTLIAKVKLEDD